MTRVTNESYTLTCYLKISERELALPPLLSIIGQHCPAIWFPSHDYNTEAPALDLSYLSKIIPSYSPLVQYYLLIFATILPPYICPVLSPYLWHNSASIQIPWDDDHLVRCPSLKHKIYLESWCLTNWRIYKECWKIFFYNRSWYICQNSD